MATPPPPKTPEPVGSRAAHSRATDAGETGKDRGKGKGARGDCLGRNLAEIISADEFTCLPLAFRESLSRRFRDQLIPAMSKAAKKKKSGLMSDRVARAPAHVNLANTKAHVFVDDQNLFYGITNDKYGKNYRLDFGRLLLEAVRDDENKARPVGSAYVAGVIPDDDYFWQVAKNQGFQVRRGYLGSSGRSKQDDAYLITEMMETLYEKDGPSTIILVAGDADYMPPLQKAVAKGWRVEVVFIGHSISVALEPVTHKFRELDPTGVQKYENFPI